jgi:hypothetical protein
MKVKLFPIGKTIVLIMLASIVVAFASYRYGVHAQQKAEYRNAAYSQATLAFGHYKVNERIEWLLLQRCYDAALTEVRELKNLQLTLLSENFRATENHPELAAYIKLRDPQVLETVLAGRVPELKPYTTFCP